MSATDVAARVCSVCGRSPRSDEDVRKNWRVGADDAGDLHPFCPECWEKELAGDPVPTTIKVGPTNVILGRGVVAYVMKRGGSLYVWGDSVGRKYQWMKASTTSPSDERFVRSGVVDAFDLYIEDDLPPWWRLKLARRWWGLRDGVTVSTGLGVEPWADQAWVAGLFGDADTDPPDM